MFDTDLRAARSGYHLYVQERIVMGRRKNLIGGGLVRSHGGWAAVKELRRLKAYQKGDERILGDGDFVEEIFRKSEEQLERKFQLKAQGFHFDKVVDRTANLLKISSAEVLAR